MPPKTKKMKYGLQIIIGLYRISYNDALKLLRWKILQEKSKKDTNDFGVKIFEFRNEIFLIHKTWYTYNSISNQLVKKLFNSNFKNTSDIVKIDEDHFILLQRDYYIRWMLKEITSPEI
jgi:hypothetical protein